MCYWHKLSPKSVGFTISNIVKGLRSNIEFSKSNNTETRDWYLNSFKAEAMKLQIKPQVVKKCNNTIT
jgi:hypothetical protein